MKRTNKKYIYIIEKQQQYYIMVSALYIIITFMCMFNVVIPFGTISTGMCVCVWGSDFGSPFLSLNSFIACMCNFKHGPRYIFERSVAEDD